MTWKTIKYDGQVDFSGFSCSKNILNEYLHKKAVKDQADNLCSLYFLINDQGHVGGFYVLSSGSIRRQQLPSAKARKNLPGYPLGTIHIGRLARDKNIIKQKLGDLLILSALDVAASSNKVVAAHAITVDAKDQEAEAYYSRYSFKVLISDSTKNEDFPKAMYLKMKDALFILNTSAK